MANKVTIDVEARFNDNLSNQAKTAAQSVQKVGDAAEETKKDVDKLGKTKAKPTVDADNSKLLKKLNDADNRVKKLSKSKASVVLDAIDKASNVLKKVSNTAKSLTSKAWTAVIKVKDIALAPLKKLKNALFNIKTLIGTVASALAAGFVIKNVVINPINVADAYSSAKISFSTLLGDQQGQQMMDELDEFARKTPFDTSNVISNAQKMLAMGWDPEDIIKDMEILGDAAASTGKLDQGLESIVRAMSQIKTKGRLSTEELNQLAEAGIAAKAMLAEQLGYGTGDEGIAKMTEDLEDGAIASNQAIEALLAGMQKYSGMMESMATETAEGLWSQLKDTFQINIYRKWGQGLQEGAKKGLGTVLDLLDSVEGGLESIGDMLFEAGKKLSNWGAGKLEWLVGRITALAETDEFKNAGLGGKVKILWDGIVADPIKEWWEGGGREKTIATAGDIGAWIGKTLSTGLLTIFGATEFLEDGGVKSTAASIAESFVEGFKANFDGSVITQAFVDAIGNVWGALPTWAQWLLGGYGAAKLAGGIANLAGGVLKFGKGIVTGIGSRGVVTGGGTVTGASGLLGLIGRAGAGGVGASGILGGLANTGYKVLGGTSALSVGGGTAALVGAGTALGIGTGVGTAISGGIDLYKGYTNDDETAKKSGWWKVGGGVGGLAAGAAIGTMLGGPLIGTAIGGLIGGGVGLIGSYFTKKNAAEKAAEAAQAESGALEDLANSESAAAVEAAKLIEKNNKLAKASLDKHFGDITLSAEEMQKAIRNMIGEQFFTETAAASEAINTMNMSFENLKTQSSALKKDLWMASIKRDAKLTAEEVTGLQSSADSFSSAAQTYVTDAQYAAVESISSIMGNSKDAEKLIASTNDYYASQSDELAKLSNQLKDELAAALSDNVISIDEKKSLDNIRNQMAEITRKLQEEEYEAEMNILKAKYAGDMTAEGFGDLMKGSAEQNEALAESYWDAFGRASIGKSEEQIEDLRKGVLDKLSSMWSNTGDLGIGTLREQYSEELGILGQDIGTMLEKNTPEAIMSAVENMSDETRQGIGKLMEYMQPTTDEIEALVKAYEDAGMKVPEALTSYLQTAEFYEALSKGPEAVAKYFNEQEIDVDAKLNLHPSLQNDKFKDAKHQLETVFTTMEVTGNLNVDWKYDKFDDEWISPDGQYAFTTEALLSCGWKYDEFNRMWISPDEKYYFYTNAEVGVDYDNNKFEGSKTTFGVRESYNTSTTVNVAVDYKISGGMGIGGPKMSYASKQAVLLRNQARGSLIYPSGQIDSFAMGGKVTPMGNGRIVRVAEEGPEMIIPLSKQRRERGLDLWSKAGRFLNVPGFARGGITRGTDEGFRFRRYNDTSDTNSGKTIQIDVGGITLEIQVNGTDAQSIAAAIKAQVADIAEDVAGVLADAFAAQFENTPTRGGVA